jgi:hypothetical protein
MPRQDPVVCLPINRPASISELFRDKTLKRCDFLRLPAVFLVHNGFFGLFSTFLRPNIAAIFGVCSLTDVEYRFQL